MATDATQLEVITEAAPQRGRAMRQRTPEQPLGGRLVSLDAYRGFIMLLLVSEGFGLSVLRHYPNWSWLAAQVDHAAWEGCTLWDLIQPAFTFMVGVAMPFSIARRIAQGATHREVFRHVAYRSFMLILLSNIYSNWGPANSGLVLQFINVLSQIAFGYMICYWIMRMKLQRQIAAALVMLAGYWALFAMFPGPDGPWSKTGNIGAVIDRKVLGYNYPGCYTTINFIGNAVTILFGCWTGMLLRADKPHSCKIKLLGACAASGLALGLALQPVNPMVKRLWTTSFTFFSAGWVILMLIVFYWLIEIKQLRRWAFPFVVLGTNSIFIYSLGQLGLKGWLHRGLGNFTKNFAFLGDPGMIPQHLLVLGLMWYACYWLYQRKIFFKI
jgi:heparan-alpha-glucosaminide N-acetyltransferase